MLEVASVNKKFGTVEVLRDISFTVQTGTRTAIVGPSGSGKTTLLRIIAGFEVPDRGRVTIDCEVLVDGSTVIPAHLRRIGYVAQDGALFPHLTVARNIAFGMDRETDKDAKITELMTLVGLKPELTNRWPHQLSGGQQQRVALARALARKPRLMLLDEPFSALDARLRGQTRKAVANVLGAARITTILVTHDEAEALSFADQVAVMRNGRLMRIAAPREVYLRPRDRSVAELVGQAVIIPVEISGGRGKSVLGDVAVDAPQRSGKASILVRPEQLRIAKTDEAAAQNEGRSQGQVIDVDFRGASCMIAVRIESVLRDGHESQTVLVQCGNGEVPHIGQRVTIEMVAPAHVLQD